LVVDGSLVIANPIYHRCQNPAGVRLSAGVRAFGLGERTVQVVTVALFTGTLKQAVMLAVTFTPTALVTGLWTIYCNGR
jgi:hypothetical protein